MYDLKKKLEELLKKGKKLNDEEVVKVSQELDKLVIKKMEQIKNGTNK